MDRKTSWVRGVADSFSGQVKTTLISAPPLNSSRREIEPLIAFPSLSYKIAITSNGGNG